jgi:ADP-heptose:LPS heptosyltransferase
MRILVIRVGRVGDTIMMTPALAALLDVYPEATLTIVASPEGSRLLKNYHPRVEAIWIWNRYGLQSHFDKKRLIRQIAEAHFDLAFCFDTNPGIARLLVASTAKIYIQKNLGPPVHCARHYLNTIEQACGQKLDHYYNNVPVADKAAQQVAHELSQHGISDDDTVVMLHPTYSGYSKLGLRKRHARKRKLWPAQNYAELAGRLLKSGDEKNKKIKILMVLLPSELTLGKKIVRLCHSPVTLLPSESGFERYLAMIQRADVFVSPDTGPMHIASALNTRVVAMFSDKDPSDCGPYMEPDRFWILRSELTRHPEKGISAISVDAVYRACMQQIAAEQKS